MVVKGDPSWKFAMLSGVFPDTVLFLSVAVPPLKIPPPHSCAVLFETVQLVTVIVPLL